MSAEELTPTNITPLRTGFTPRAQWLGLGHLLSVLWHGVGLPPALPKTKDHASWARGAARAASLPVMCLFSFGALIKLSHDQLQVYLEYLVHGQVDQIGQHIIGLVQICTILGLIVLMDLLMIVKCVDWIDKKANGESYSSERSFVLFVALVEGVTYTMLLHDQEHPAPLLIAGTINWAAVPDWALILLRAFAVPLVTITSATLGNKVVTEKERKLSLKAQADNAIAASLRLLTLDPSLVTLPTVMAYRTYLDDLTPEEEQAKNNKDAKLFEHFQRLMPGAVEAAARAENDRIRLEAEHDRERSTRDADERIAQVQRDYATQIDQEHRRHLEDAQATEHRFAQLEAEQEQRIQALLRQMLPWLLEVLEHQVWPAALLEAAPEYQRIDPARFLKGGAMKAQRATNAAPSTPQSAADDLRQLCTQQNVKVVASVTERDAAGTKTTRKPKGVWIRSSDIVALSGDALTQDEAKELAGRWGNGAKDGTAFAAPLRMILKELARRNALKEPWFTWQRTHEGEAITEESKSEEEVVA